MSVGENGQFAAQREDLRQIDGADRVPLLPHAHMIAVAPGVSHDERSDDPVYVFIEWAPGMVERPYPGSAIWRAVLEQSLEHWQSQEGESGEGRAQNTDNVSVYAHVDDVDDEHADQQPSDLFRSAIQADLARFPSLDAWLRWRDHDRVVANS